MKGTQRETETAQARADTSCFAPLLDSVVVRQLADALGSDARAVQVRGVHGGLKGILLASLFRRIGKQCVILCPDTHSALEVWNDVSVMLGEEDVLYIGEHLSTLQKKIRNISSTFAENADALRSLTERPLRVVVTDVDTLATEFPSVRAIREQSVSINAGLDFPQDNLVRALAFGGFERVDFVSTTGEYAVRGGILDVFPVGMEQPLRIEYFGDEIESIREFDPLSQRSTTTREQVAFVTSLFLEDGESARDRMPAFFTGDAVLVFDGMESIAGAVDESDAPLLDTLRERHRCVLFSVMEQEADAVIEANTESQPALNGSVKHVLELLTSLEERGYNCTLVADSEAQAQRLDDLLHSTLPEEDNGHRSMRRDIRYCPLSEGFIDHGTRLAVLTEHQIFQRRHVQKRVHKGVKGLSLREMRQLRIGDYVVHVDKGIGRFVGFNTITVNGGLQETAQLTYADDDVLYVNLNYINKLQKYSSTEGAVPLLSKLGSGAWERAKERTKRRLKDIARDLIQLYAKRKMSEGFAFSADSQWQKEMEASFMYEDTPDQAKATAEVKADMETAVPMDRLVCGDVGYGKTEVAVRAAFKAVADGRQVAVLVPTTILAEQHYNTFRDRLARYAVNVASLSRFKTKKEQEEVTGKLERGSIDIVIGTHRMLSKDVRFRNLGLLIVDEEHRFGVAAKEKLRQLRTGVDTLTMTATPIPRTLNFSLLGARDLSVIETPPRNRLPIITRIVPFEKEVVVEGIERELQRGGQVFFVNDTVSDLEALADTIRVYLPGVRVAIAHGQMKPPDLERTMLHFIEKKTDVLVATKIIESGLDIPNANTMFINKAHHFGLAELYQLRGRVGRSNVQAYAYLLVPPKAKFSRDALKRLQAIEEFSELGTGFQLAMRDLEIRGAGNLLGAEQSGFITEIGFELYMSTLEEAVQELKQQEFQGLFAEEVIELRPRADVVMELGQDAYLPRDYVSNATERFDIYKRLYNCERDEEIDEIEYELLDRFGRLPEEADNLFFSVRVRLIAARIRLSRVTLEDGTVNMALPPEDDAAFYDHNFQPLMQWVQTNKLRAVMKRDQRQVRILVREVRTPADVRALLVEMESAVLAAEATEAAHV
ncbi:MAG TPA: transcription-repair coupling factor [Bacteroidota bacterium]|nr:transcription-repair coupling factor [Bacteroidota bacterium]